MNTNKQQILEAINARMRDKSLTSKIKPNKKSISIGTMPQELNSARRISTVAPHHSTKKSMYLRATENPNNYANNRFGNRAGS